MRKLKFLLSVVSCFLIIVCLSTLPSSRALNRAGDATGALSVAAQENIGGMILDKVLPLHETETNDEADAVTETPAATSGQDDAEADSDFPYDPQPVSLADVQAWIDTYVGSDYDLSQRPHWQYQVAASLLPSGWRCETVEDADYSDGLYWTIFSIGAARAVGQYPIEIYNSANFIDANRVQYYTLATHTKLASAIDYVNTNSTTRYWLAINGNIHLQSTLTVSNTAGVTITNGVTSYDVGLFWNGSNSTSISNARHFIVDTNGRLTLKNIILYGSWNGSTNSPTGGGGIYARSNSTFTMESRAAIEKCYVASSRNLGGGGVMIDGGTFNMTGGTINANMTSYTTGFYAGGGVCLYKGTFNMTDGTISNNVAATTSDGIWGGGVAMHQDCAFTMDGGTISNNTAIGAAGAYGGGVYGANNSTMTMTGGTIKKNKSTSNNSYGGGIFLSGPLTMTGGTISDNVAEGMGFGAYGGGVYVYALTMMGGTISDNNAASSAAEGGGVYVTGTGICNVENATISGNTATGAGRYAEGGGIYRYDGVCTIDNSKILDNTAKGNTYVYGGGVRASTVAMDNVMLDGNTATSATTTALGGGVYGTAGVTITGGIVNNNTAKGYTNVYGGGIHAVGPLTIEETFIHNNHVEGTEGAMGGGVYVNVAGNCAVTMNDSSLSGNTATTGGGINVAGSNNIPCQLSLENVTISGNTASTAGGGIYMNGNACNLRMTGGTIGGSAANTASTGGGVYMSGGNLSMNNGTVSNNKANSLGGGIYISDGTITLNRAEISRNTANTHGGGIYMTASATVNITNSTIIANKALSGNGGGIYTANTIDYSNLNIDESTVFSEDQAAVDYQHPLDAQTLLNIYPSIKTTSHSSYEHPLNNDDINFVAYIVKVSLDTDTNWQELGNVAVSFTAGGAKQTAIFSEEIDHYSGYPSNNGSHGIEKLVSGAWSVNLNLPAMYGYEVYLNETAVGAGPIIIADEDITVIEIKISKTATLPWGKWLYKYRAGT